MSLVGVFSRKLFTRLRQKRELVSLLAAIVRNFGWEGVSAPFVRVFDRLPYSVGMSLTSQLADALIDITSVRTALTIIAVQKAGFAFATCPDDLVASSDVVLLWKHATECSSPHVFRDVGNVFARLDAEIIGPVVDALSKCDGVSWSPEYRGLLISMASRHRQGLMDQIAESEKPLVLVA